MDLSQDIALAFIYLEKWIPCDLLTSVAKQPCLSVGKEKYKELAKEVISQLKSTAKRFRYCAKDWKENVSHQ